MQSTPRHTAVGGQRMSSMKLVGTGCTIGEAGMEKTIGRCCSLGFPANVKGSCPPSRSRKELCFSSG